MNPRRGHVQQYFAAPKNGDTINRHFFNGILLNASGAAIVAGTTRFNFSNTYRKVPHYVLCGFKVYHLEDILEAFPERRNIIPSATGDYLAWWAAHKPKPRGRTAE